MAVKLYSKSQRVYRALDWSINFTVKGGGLMQQHDADNDLYYPDRTVTPTLIEPVFHIVDRDTRSSKVATDSLINVSWSEIVNGGEEKPCNSPDYDVITQSTQDLIKGAIIVNKNVKYPSTITLKFRAQFYDSKRKRTMKVEKDVSLTTMSVASLLLFTKLNRPNTYLINPFELETKEQYQDTITPLFQLGDERVTDLSIIGGWWYTVKNNVETPVNVNEDICFDAYDTSTYSLTIDKRCFDDVLLRFKSSLHPDKVIPATPPSNCNIQDIRIIRKYPNGIEFKQVTTGDGIIDGSSTYTRGRVIVTGPQGVITNPDKYWTFDWKIKNSVPGSTYKLVANGSGPVILPVGDEDIDILCEVNEKGAFCALTSSTGSLITSPTGKVIIAQKERRG